MSERHSEGENKGVSPEPLWRGGQLHIESPVKMTGRAGLGGRCFPLRSRIGRNRNDAHSRFGPYPNRCRAGDPFALGVAGASDGLRPVCLDYIVTSPAVLNNLP